MYFLSLDPLLSPFSSIHLFQIQSYLQYANSFSLIIFKTVSFEADRIRGSSRSIAKSQNSFLLFALANSYSTCTSPRRVSCVLHRLGETRRKGRRKKREKERKKERGNRRRRSCSRSARAIT